MLVSSIKSFLARFRAPAGLLGLLLLLVAPALWSCNGQTAYSKATQDHQDLYRAIDDTIIQHYLARHNYTAATYKRTDSGLYLVTLKSGTGPAATVGKQVTVKYVGRYISRGIEGYIFDNSADNHTSCGCGSGTVGTFASGYAAGSGINEALQLMHQGDRVLLFIPSYLAYGPTGNGSVPADTPLLFDMELLTVSQ